MFGTCSAAVIHYTCVYVHVHALCVVCMMPHMYTHACTHYTLHVHACTHKEVIVIQFD